MSYALSDQHFNYRNSSTSYTLLLNILTVQECDATKAWQMNNGLAKKYSNFKRLILLCFANSYSLMPFCLTLTAYLYFY